MFKLQRTPGYWWPVKVSFPVDGGNWEEEDFEVRFPRFDQPALTALAEKIAGGEKNAATVATSLVLDWRQVVGADGTVIPYTTEAMANLCRLPGVPQAIFEAFMQSHAKAAQGN